MGPPGAPGLEVSVAGPHGRWDLSPAVCRQALSGRCCAEKSLEEALGRPERGLEQTPWERDRRQETGRPCWAVLACICFSARVASLILVSSKVFRLKEPGG